MTRYRFAAVVVLVATAAAVVASRPGAGEQRVAQVVPQSSVAAPGAADLDFARQMVTHHAQAVRMSRTLTAKPGVPERIRAIAEFVARDQQREIEEMNAWLAAWGDTPHATAHDHGMISAAQERQLATAPGDRAGPLFLRLMIEHHDGAIAMARTLLDAGARNVWTDGLARHVINEQTDENKAMAALLRPDDR